MNYEDLGPGPDINDIDESQLNFGNDPAQEAKVEAPVPSQEELEKKVAKANGEAPPEEEEPAGEEDGEPARDEKGRFTGKGVIPIDRHKATLDKEREARTAAEQRAAELERRLQEQAKQAEASQNSEQMEARIEELEAKYQELLLDGNIKESSAVMKQIRHMERQIATAEAEQRAATRTAQTLEAERLEASIARLEADHPELNAESESYDADLVALVITKQRQLIADGMSPSKAMEKAGQEVAKRFLTPQQAAESLKGLAKANEGRQKQAVAKALATQNAQPASMKEVGFDSDSRGDNGLPDVSKMSADEFAALPKATQDRLMGNLV